MDNALALNEKGAEYRSLKNWHLFLLLVVTYAALAFVNDKFIMTRAAYMVMYSDKMETGRIDDSFELLSRLKIYAYLALPLILWLKIAFIALVLQTILVLKKMEAGFGITFRISILANTAFLFMALVKTVILLMVPQSQYTPELISSIPASITNLLQTEKYSQTALSFLSSINVYELGWVIILSIALKKNAGVEQSDAILISFSLWISITVVQTGLMFYLSNV